jgi:hypothetical protein
MNTHPLLARLVPLTLADASAAPGEIMVFPAGKHTINATRAGKPVTKTIMVGPDTAAAMQAALAAHIEAAEQKPYFDFDHDDTKASAWPTSYRWEPGTAGKPAGVYAQVEWSASGAAAVLGKDYRSFSPAFHIDEASPARVVGAPLNMGGLVNSPAFRRQAPIWAKGADELSAATPDQENQDIIIMNEDEKKKAEAAAAALESQALQAKENNALKTKVEALEAKATALEAKEKERIKLDAKAAVDTAVARGALAPKDEALQAKWRGLIESDPKHLELLNTLPGRDLTQQVTSSGGHIQAKAGVVEVLKGYQSEKDAQKRGAIFAKDLAPHFTAGFQLGPILAANSLGTLAGELVVQRSLSFLRTNYPFLFAITTDFSGENAAFDQTVKTRLKGALTANAFVAGTGYGSNNASTTDVPITINRHFGVPVTFNVNELASTRRDLFGEQAEAMHSALADEMVDDLLALITPANFPNSTVSTLNNFARTTMTTVAKELSIRKVPSMGRMALLNPDFFAKLQNDTTIVQLAAFRQPELITEYQLPKVSGLQPYESISLPSTNDLAGFACTPEALAIATRLPNDYAQALPGASNGVVTSIFNEPTGITVQLVQFVDHVKAEATARVALMWGVAKGNPATGERIRTSEGS